MRYNLDDILRMDNFDNLSKYEMIEVIHALKDNLKYYKYQRDHHQDTLNNTINGLKNEIQLLNSKVDTVNKQNSNILKKVFKPLTIMERIKGKIDINK
jgi:hypothetical protein